MEVWSRERRGRMIEENILKGFNEPRVVFPGGTRAEKRVPSHHHAEEGFYPTSRRLLSPPTLRSRHSTNSSKPPGLPELRSGEMEPSPHSQQTKQPGPWLLPLLPGLPAPRSRARSSKSSVFQQNQGPGVEGRGLHSLRLLLHNEPKQSRCQSALR